MERALRAQRPQSHQMDEELPLPRSPYQYQTSEEVLRQRQALETFRKEQALEISRKEQMEEGWDADAVDALRGYAPLSHDATTAEKLEWKHLKHESNQELLKRSNNDYPDDENSWDLIDGQPKPAGPPPIPGSIEAKQSLYSTASTRLMSTQPVPRHMPRDSDASGPDVVVHQGRKRRTDGSYVPLYGHAPLSKDYLRYRQQFERPEYVSPPPGYVGSGVAQDDILSSASESRPKKRLAKQRRPSLPHVTPSGMNLMHAKKDEDILQDALGELKALKMENERLRQDACQAPVSSQPVYSYRVFYQIRGVLYLDEPCWEPSEGSSVILLAKNPIRRLEHYLDRHPEIAFAIYKDYKQDLLPDSREIEGVDGIYRSPIPTHELLSFVSPEMRSAVKELVQQIPKFDYYFPHFRFNRDIAAPYLFMYYSTPFMTGVLPKLSMRSRNLIKQLQAVVTESYGHEYTSVKLQAEKGMIARKYLKYLVRPGDVLVSSATEGNIPQACIARAWIGAPETTLEDPELEEWEHVGKQLIEGHDSLVNSVSGRKMTKYVWKVPVWNWSFDGNFGRHETSIEDRYMVDTKSFKMLFPDSNIAQMRLKHAMSAAVMANDQPPEEGDALLVVPSTIMAHNLQEKVWRELLVDQITDINWNKQAFKDLVAEAETKELVQALVMKQINARRSTDFVAGKGNGLIMLLHGAPGTGKTFTAEGVAEFAEKPLLRITCGDIGTEPEVVDQRLRATLRLGKLWDCVDEAFKSRIQLALHYDNLGPAQRKKIWRNFITRMKTLEESSSADMEDILDHVDELSKEPMNGREIRNAITIARQLAQFREQRFQYSHLKHAMNVGSRFSKYLNDLRMNYTDDMIKQDSGIRFSYTAVAPAGLQ
ncbi:unnamed protein product [Alternaria alternata]